MKIEIENSNSAEESDKQIVRENLKKLSIADLCNVLGDDMVRNLEANGLPIEVNSLTEQIISQQLYRVFENEKIRGSFTYFYKIDPIIRWRDNKQCREFLEITNLSDSFLPKTKSRRKLLEEVNPEFTLHDYQDHLKRQTSEFLLSDKNLKLMIQLPTGSGKTALAMNSIYDYLRISNFIYGELLYDYKLSKLRYIKVLRKLFQNFLLFFLYLGSLQFKKTFICTSKLIGILKFLNFRIFN